MVSLIRSDHGNAPFEGAQSAAHRLSGLAIVLGVFILIMLAACAWVALRFSDILGPRAGVILWGIVGLGAVGVVTLFIKRPKPVKGVTGIDGVNEAFLRSPKAALITRGGKPVHANSAYLELAQSLGIINVSEMAPTIDRIFGGADKDSTAAIFRLHHLSENIPHAEERIDHIDDMGRLRSFHIHVTALTDGHYWQVSDVSGDETREDQMLARVPIGLFTVDQDGNVIAVNENLKTWVGVSGHENKGRVFKHMSEFVDNPEALLDSPRSPGRVVRTDTRLITQKGVATPTVMVAIWRELSPEKYIAHVALHGHSSLAPSRTDDNTPEPRPENQRKSDASRDMSESEFIAAPIAILELDGTKLWEAQVLRANAAFETMSGIYDWRDKPFSDVFKIGGPPLGFLEMDGQDCTPDVPYDAVLSGSTGLSVSTYIVADPAADLCRVYLVDISQRKSLEDQLVQSQKMQAIGRLVAEIAHDFNNLLAAMRLYTDTLLSRHPIGDPSYPELQQINSNVNRAAALVKKLLAYSRKQTLRAVKIDVSERLSDIAVTLKQVLGERTQLDIIHGRNLPPIKVDKSQLDTVLMNLAVNARDAMKEQGGGNITIESKSLQKLDIKAAGLRGALESIDADEFVVISVTDTGTGITDEIKSRIFEPFFTTKPQGEGTGLGLSTVYGIVQQSGGHLNVDSEMGVGTTFSIYLPAFHGEDEEDVSDEQTRKASGPTVRPPADLAGQGNILFVEDEDSVRVIAAKTLRKRGYNVVEACDGEEAFELIEDAETKFDLMISDVVMPGMDGPTLLKKARPMLADTRIVFISGYAEEEFSELLSEEPDVTFLPKPFSLIELAEKVKAEIGVSSV